MRKRSEERSARAPTPRWTARLRLRRRRRFEEAGVRILSRIPLTTELQLYQQKSPTRQPGACGIAPSREERGQPRHGRVAWLTALQPITVAGPRPIHTAFPASLACKLSFECMPGARKCQCTAENGEKEHGATGTEAPVLSDFSNWVCVFRPAHADLPANPRGGRVHSRKYSWNA